MLSSILQMDVLMIRLSKNREVEHIVRKQYLSIIGTSISLNRREIERLSKFYNEHFSKMDVFSEYIKYAIFAWRSWDSADRKNVVGSIVSDKMIEKYVSRKTV